MVNVTTVGIGRPGDLVTCHEAFQADATGQVFVVVTVVAAALQVKVGGFVVADAAAVAAVTVLVVAYSRYGLLLSPSLGYLLFVHWC